VPSLSCRIVSLALQSLRLGLGEGPDTAIDRWRNDLSRFVTLLVTRPTPDPESQPLLLAFLVQLSYFLCTLSSAPSPTHKKESQLLRWRLVLEVYSSLRASVPLSEAVFQELLERIVASGYCSMRELVSLLPLEMDDCRELLSLLKRLK
jgi:hypothetical protein